MARTAKSMNRRHTPARLAKTATLKPKDRVEHVMLTLGQRIVSNVYPPDSALPTEPQLCEELHVGRNAVREAIKMLASKGFLRTSRRAGTLVLPVSRWSMLDPQVLSWILKDRRIRDKLIEDLTTVRRIIEPEVAALAAAHASAKDTLRLFEAFEAMGNAVGDRDASIEADVSFHERLFEAAHNPLLTSLSRAFAVLLHANFEIAIERKNAFIRNLSGHGRVAEAVHRRDAVEARREMLQLLDNNDEDIHQMIHGGGSAAESRGR
jgi:GntR family transcriptional regulator, galactonate operon transcriptional repressor